MASLADVSLEHITSLRSRIEQELRPAPSLDAAAQGVAELLFREFASSTVLIRIFGTTPYSGLPQEDRQLVTALAEERGCAREITEATTVISLLGTRGRRPAWNDRRRSRRRRAIPLVSASFVKTIPMVARLMSDAGTHVGWVEKQNSHIVVREMGLMVRLLYVDDAARAVTGDGYKVVPAQDFVEAEGVRSVLGMGGSYLGGTFIAIIWFTDVELSQRQAERFMPLLHAFKTITMAHAMKGRIFGC